MSEKPTCNTCPFFTTDRCRRFPPVDGAFSPVRQNQWCGEHPDINERGIHNRDCKDCVLYDDDPDPMAEPPCEYWFSGKNGFCEHFKDKEADAPPMPPAPPPNVLIEEGTDTPIPVEEP